jgi:hypothetical protein
MGIDAKGKPSCFNLKKRAKEHNVQMPSFYVRLATSCLNQQLYIGHFVQQN